MGDLNGGYFIGQRVLYGNVLCTVVPPETDPNDPAYLSGRIVWVDNPEKGYKHWVSVGNAKPLPNGQL